MRPPATPRCDACSHSFAPKKSPHSPSKARGSCPASHAAVRPSPHRSAANPCALRDQNHPCSQSRTHWPSWRLAAKTYAFEQHTGCDSAKHARNMSFSTPVHTTLLRRRWRRRLLPHFLEGCARIYTRKPQTLKGSAFRVSG